MAESGCGHCGTRCGRRWIGCGGSVTARLRSESAAASALPTDRLGSRAIRKSSHVAFRYSNPFHAAWPIGRSALPSMAMYVYCAGLQDAAVDDRELRKVRNRHRYLVPGQDPAPKQVRHLVGCSIQLRIRETEVAENERGPPRGGDPPSLPAAIRGSPQSWCGPRPRDLGHPPLQTATHSPVMCCRSFQGDALRCVCAGERSQAPQPLARCCRPEGGGAAHLLWLCAE